MNTPFLDGVPATAPTKLWTSWRWTLLSKAYRFACMDIWLNPKISSLIIPSIPPSLESFVTIPEFLTSPPYPIAWSNFTTNRSNSCGFLLNIVVRIWDCTFCFILSYESANSSSGVRSSSFSKWEKALLASLFLELFFGVFAFTVTLMNLFICSSVHEESIDSPFSLIL